MDAYNDSTTNKRKLLIPLVVLMLCSVALTGAAYAYNASLIGQNEIDTEYYTIHFGDSHSTDTFEVTDFVLGFDTTNNTTTPALTYTIRAVEGNDPSFTITVKGYNQSDAVHNFKVTDLSDALHITKKSDSSADVTAALGATITADNTNLANTHIFTISFAKGTEVSADDIDEFYVIKVTLNSDDETPAP